MSNWKFAAIEGCAIVLLGLIGIVLRHEQDQTYRRMLGDERVETRQNTIPFDVRQWIQKGVVLGVNSNTWFLRRPLPKEARIPILMYHYVEYVKDKGDTIRHFSFVRLNN